MISLRAYSVQKNIEVQALRVLVKNQLLPVVIKEGKRKSYSIDPNHIPEQGLLIKCKCCGKQMISISPLHFRVCKELTYREYVDKGYPTSSAFGTERRIKTEEQKKRQSLTLKERFKTAAGAKTKELISKASKATREDPAFLAKVSATTRERYNDREERDKSSRSSKKMWADPSFRKRREKYVKENIDSLRKSAANARKHNNSTSKLHLKVKAHLERNGVRSQTEYQVGYYKIDEAIPGYKIGIEVDGCYWHGCSKCGFPGVSGNSTIDKRKNTYFYNKGWTIVRIKECDFKEDAQKSIELLLMAIKEAAPCVKV